MKRLILMRHAKSSWDDLDLPANDRTLNDRGRADCALIAEWMTAQSLAPTSVVCSTAQRCVETCETVFQHLGQTPDATFKHALYHESDTQILAQIHAQSEDTIMVIAHNPGSGSFAGRIVTNPPEHRKFLSYPTAAMTVVDFDVSNWSGAQFGQGKLSHFITPSDLR